MFSNIQNAEHLEGLENLQLLRAHCIHAPIPSKVNDEILRLPQTLEMKIKEEMNVLSHLEARTSGSIEAQPLFKKVAHRQKSKEIRVMAQPSKSKAHILQTWIRNRKLSGHSFPFTVSWKLL